MSTNHDWTVAEEAPVVTWHTRSELLCEQWSMLLACLNRSRIDLSWKNHLWVYDFGDFWVNPAQPLEIG